MANRHGITLWKPIVLYSKTSPRHGAPGGDHGFTLVELLLALFLFALVASVVFAAFAAIANGVDKGRQSMELYRVGRTALFRMAQEITGALPAPETVATGTTTGTTATTTAGLTGKKGAGSGKFPHDRVEFMTIPYRYHTAQSAAYEKCRLAYYLAENVQGGISLVREEDCSGEEAERRDHVTRLEMTDLAIGLSFTYYDADNNYEEWPPVQGDDTMLPCRVRIALTLGDARQYERSFITVASLPMRGACEDERTRQARNDGSNGSPNNPPPTNPPVGGGTGGRARTNR